MDIHHMRLCPPINETLEATEFSADELNELKTNPLAFKKIALVYVFENLLKCGAMFLHGPHHSAVKRTTTNRSLVDATALS